MPGTDTRTDLRPDFGALRLILFLAGCGALVWSGIALPAFWNERPIVAAGRAIAAGESFRPQVLNAIDARLDDGGDERLRAAVLNRAVMIRLRQAEVAMRATETAVTDRALSALSVTLDRALRHAPGDSMLWLTHFWVRNALNGFQPGHLASLQRSYETAPREAWVALKRNRYALPILSAMPSNLVDIVVAEYVEFVQWGLIRDAAEIAAGPGRAFRPRLFGALSDVPAQARQALSRELYRRDLDDVVIPGIEFPKPSWAIRLEEDFKRQKSKDAEQKK